MTKETAYAIVFNDLLDCPMFKGIYDAENGNKHFMYGIETVMENIAYHVDEDYACIFAQMFIANMEKSEKEEKTLDNQKQK